MLRIVPRTMAAQYPMKPFGQGPKIRKRRASRPLAEAVVCMVSVALPDGLTSVPEGGLIEQVVSVSAAGTVQVELTLTDAGSGTFAGTVA